MIFLRLDRTLYLKLQNVLPIKLVFYSRKREIHVVFAPLIWQNYWFLEFSFNKTFVKLFSGFTVTSKINFNLVRLNKPVLICFVICIEICNDEHVVCGSRLNAKCRVDVLERHRRCWSLYKCIRCHKCIFHIYTILLLRI